MSGPSLPVVFVLGVRDTGQTYQARDAANTVRVSRSGGEEVALWAALAKLTGLDDRAEEIRATYALVREPQKDWATTGDVVWKAWLAVCTVVQAKLVQAEDADPTACREGMEVPDPDDDVPFSGAYWIDEHLEVPDYRGEVVVSLQRACRLLQAPKEENVHDRRALRYVEKALVHLYRAVEAG